jgi:hypothetical protein
MRVFQNSLILRHNKALALLCLRVLFSICGFTQLGYTNVPPQIQTHHVHFFLLRDKKAPNELDASVEQYNCLLYQCNLSDIEAALTHTCFKIRSFITFIELYIGEIVFMKEVD